MKTINKIIKFLKELSLCDFGIHDYESYSQTSFTGWKLISKTCKRCGHYEGYIS